MLIHFYTSCENWRLFQQELPKCVGLSSNVDFRGRGEQCLKVRLLCFCRGVEVKVGDGIWMCVFFVFFLPNIKSTKSTVRYIHTQGWLQWDWTYLTFKNATMESLFFSGSQLQTHWQLWVYLTDRDRRLAYHNTVTSVALQRVERKRGGKEQNLPC